MLFYNKVLATLCLLAKLICHINAQGPPSPPVTSSGASVQIGQGAEKFCLEFLKQISDAHITAPTRSYMVSPFSVWSLLLLLTEGAGGNTLTELRNTLHTGNDQNLVRAAYQVITRFLTVNTTTIEVASFNALFTDINKPVRKEYEDTVERHYGSALIPVNFNDVNNTFIKINNDIREATRGLIPYTVTPQDIQDVKMLMVSSLYFKGKWKHPFEASKTRPLPFHDEDGKILGNVQMMTQTGFFPYANVKALDAHVLELPYGEQNRLSMLIVLPKIGVKLNKVVHALSNVGIKEIHKQLQDAFQKYEFDEVEVFLPKFTTESHFNLRPILRNMGIQELFDSARANLNKISSDNYVSSVFHATRIIVNEEGTEAGAVTVAVLGNKMGPTRFYADRPFAYLIVEKTANILLFAGEVRNYV